MLDYFNILSIRFIIFINIICCVLEKVKIETIMTAIYTMISNNCMARKTL